MKNKIEEEIEKTKKEIRGAVTTAFYDEKLAYLKGLQFGKEAIQETTQVIFDDIKKKGKYKVDKKQYGQNMMITLSEKRWKELKKKHGVK